MKLISHEVNFMFFNIYFSEEDVSGLKNHIKYFRKEKNMTQQQLADKVSVSSRTIISLEKGKYNPSVLLAYKIAKIFNISIEELFTFEEEESGL